MIDSNAARRFRQIGTITIIAVYVLILIGGIVRASGAGMGCPDWPTCFGQLTPPTDESQLPENYHEIYAERGYANTDFNPVKTWTEYLNRLSGVTIGILIMLTVWYSRVYLKSDKTVFYLSLSVLFLVSFQGWLGSVVVASNLHPFMITLHMLLAMAIVALLIYVIARSQCNELATMDTGNLPKTVKTVLIVAMAMTLLQVIMGTQVREAVDLIAQNHSYIDRQYWRNDFPVIFYVHRTFSAFILFTNAWIVWKIINALPIYHLLFRFSIGLLALVVAAILVGITLDRLGMPPAAQPIHLLIANLIFGIQFFIFISLRYSKKTTSFPKTTNPSH